MTLVLFFIFIKSITDAPPLPPNDFDFRWAKRSETIKSISNFVVYISGVRMLAIPIWGEKYNPPVCVNLQLVPEIFVTFFFSGNVSSRYFVEVCFI